MIPIRTNKEWLRYQELIKERPESFANNGQLTILTDEHSVEAFEQQSGQTIGVVYESPFNLMVVDLVEDPNGKRFAHERLLPAISKGAVVAVPIYDGKLVLLNQYRHALRRNQYAFPRGFAEAGISPADNAIKELGEELGAEVKSYRQLGTVVADSGINGNEVSVFLCELKNVELKYQYEGIESLIMLTEDELADWIANGRIDDGFTLAAFCLYRGYGSGRWFQLEENKARTSRIDKESLCIGVDGCNGGWIAAVIDQGELRIERYRDIGELTSKYISFDNMLIDMVIGLPGNIEQYERRPDSTARCLIAPRTSTIFAVPSRQAVYENSEAAQIKANKLALGKGLSKQTMALIPKMREMDEFLFKNENYKNVIKESHPEVCFARLNRAVVMSRKAEFEGLVERVNILSQFLPDLTCQFITDKAKELKCNADDIADAICLAITANFDLQGKSEAIPQVVSLDDNGLRMQMVIPEL